MKKSDFLKYVRELGLGKLLDDGTIDDPGTAKEPEKRSQTIKILRWNIENPQQESAFTRIGKMFQPRLNLAAIPMNERVDYLKALLSCRGSS